MVWHYLMRHGQSCRPCSLCPLISLLFSSCSSWTCSCVTRVTNIWDEPWRGPCSLCVNVRLWAYLRLFACGRPRVLIRAHPSMCEFFRWGLLCAPLILANTESIPTDSSRLACRAVELTCCHLWHENEAMAAFPWVNADNNHLWLLLRGLNALTAGKTAGYVDCLHCLSL